MVSRVVPGSQAALLADLDAEKPGLVVDAGTIMLGRSMRTYAPLATWLHQHYCFVLRFEGNDVYQRKQTQCASDTFPQVDQSYDFSGYPGMVAVPRTADDADAKWLPAVSGAPASFLPLPPEASLLYHPGDRQRGYRLERFE
jgi:hypothetical protein